MHSYSLKLCKCRVRNACESLPEVSCEEWSEAQRGRSLRRLHADAAVGIARHACVSPAALVLALLYLERLRTSRPDYLAFMPPNELFLVSLVSYTRWDFCFTA